MSRGLLWTPEEIDAAERFDGLDQRLAAAPNQPAVFLITLRDGAPYLGKTTLLRRRLSRLLGCPARPSRLLNLRALASRIEYQLTASRLETSLVFYEAARSHFPETYLRLLKLRAPPYLKILLSNPFPRSHVTTRLGGSRGLIFGPFRSRGAADQFENQFLDLFQMRRCREDLAPAPDHPGCIYGEMNMCLRPCQQAVSPEEYSSEVGRAVEFLSSGGHSLLDTIVSARDRSSAEMDFEEAARLHKQVEMVQHVLGLRDELVCDIDRLHGVAVTRSVASGSVELWFLLRGCWQPPYRFVVEAAGPKTVSLDRRLHEIVTALHPGQVSAPERQEHLALLARWYYSSYRDGEWIPFATLDDVPYRKLVRAVSRAAHAQTAPSMQ